MHACLLLAVNVGGLKSYKKICQNTLVNIAYIYGYSYHCMKYFISH